MRVRASAGAASFRREDRILLRRMAQMHVDMNVVIRTEQAATFRALDQAEGNQHACIFVHSLQQTVRLEDQRSAA